MQPDTQDRFTYSKIRIFLHHTETRHSDMKVSEMKLFYILFFCLPMVACRYGADIRNELSRAETLLQDAPDSALNILQSIEPDKIRKDRIRAEYA